MKNLRERWHGLTVLGVVAFAAACMTVAPAPSFADIAGGGGGGGPITEWCSDGRPKTGLVRCEDGNLRYFDPETGAMVTNQWHNEYEAVWYYFGADGTAVSGWQSIGGDKYSTERDTPLDMDILAITTRSSMVIICSILRPTMSTVNG